jgi:hypothetical protein
MVAALAIVRDITLAQQFRHSCPPVFFFSLRRHTSCVESEPAIEACQEAPTAQQPRALLRIGPWRWRTGIATLSEIAAGSFAQALLDLPCHPKVLDYAAGPLR